MKVAVVQAATVIYDTAATLKKLDSLTREAAEAGAKLILFPGAIDFPKFLVSVSDAKTVEYIFYFRSFCWGIPRRSRFWLQKP